MSQTIVLPYSSEFEQDCADIIAALPDWFGIREANATYLENLNKFPSWVAMIESKVVGVITLENPFPGSYEIHFMAVHPNFHRQGIGSLLVKRVEEEGRNSDGKWLHVKTLSSSQPDLKLCPHTGILFCPGVQPFV